MCIPWMFAELESHKIYVTFHHVWYLLFISATLSTQNEFHKKEWGRVVAGRVKATYVIITSSLFCSYAGGVASRLATTIYATFCHSP